MFRSYSSLLIILIAFVIGSCNKDDDNDVEHPPGFYFFRGNVDGFALDEVFEPEIGNGRLAEGRTGVTVPGRDGVFTQVSGVTNRCNEPGKYCFSFNVEVQGETPGNYRDSGVIVSISIPSDNVFTYTNTDYIDSFTELDVEITTIENAAGEKPGYIEGQLTGSVMKYIDHILVDTLVPVSASFRIPVP